MENENTVLQKYTRNTRTCAGSRLPLACSNRKTTATVQTLLQYYCRGGKVTAAFVRRRQRSDRFIKIKKNPEAPHSSSARNYCTKNIGYRR